MMSRLRDDSQRTVAESSLEEHGSYLLEEQLKDNEARGEGERERGTIGILSRAIKGPASIGCSLRCSRSYRHGVMQIDAP